VCLFLPGRFPPQARIKISMRLLTCGNVVPRCANRWQWVLRHPRLPRFARAVAGRITGVVLLALDFVGG
jgi:hypothetical protein